MVDTAEKARQWEDIGSDTICVSAITGNRDFNRLRTIREAVSCELQLIANASCLLHCAYEPTHMQLLTQSSRSGKGSDRFCLDYCVLHCSYRRLQDPVNFIRACWIRPEDLSRYESLGYSYFKILERSCPLDLLVKRVQAYTARSFDGNPYELVAPMASITRKLEATLFSRVRMVLSMAQLQKVKMASLLDIHAYMKREIPDEFSREKAPVYIDNKVLDGFLEEASRHSCGTTDCKGCGVCEAYTEKAVTVNNKYRADMCSRAEKLNTGILNGSLW